MTIRLSLYQPEIPQNTGTLMRLGACVGVPLDIIEPMGFVWQDQKLQRAGMDYMDLANVTRHTSWDAFKTSHSTHRIVLIDTQAATSFLDFEYSINDILLLGQESCGVPEAVFDEITHRARIPMQAGRRSLNVAIAGAMVLTEALRQLNAFPKEE